MFFGLVRSVLRAIVGVAAISRHVTTDIMSKFGVESSADCVREMSFRCRGYFFDSVQRYEQFFLIRHDAPHWYGRGNGKQAGQKLCAITGKKCWGIKEQRHRQRFKPKDGQLRQKTGRYLPHRERR